MALICSILLMARFFSMEEKREISVKVRLVFIFLKLIGPPIGEFWGNISRKTHSFQYILTNISIC